MIKRLARKFLRFRRDEDGSAMVIEFVIFVPMLLGAFLMAAEMGVYSMRQMFLDRGLDLAVRYVRLNTNVPLTHRQLKDMVCGYSGFVPDCGNTLRLEMTPIDPRQFASLPPLPDCVDVSEPVSPVRGFTLGQEQQMMLLRACVKFKPMYPTTGLGFAWEKDGSGRARMVSMAAFVQEPG
tara:strand:+ start:1132 stop:1671 length:540 start_codon:yes stop_codon:yes gene_type:complete